MEALTELAASLIAAALRSKMRIVTAESCTAGALSTLLSDRPGAGDALYGGFTCYSRAFKEQILRVSAELIERETMVSKAVAIAMAEGALDRSGASLSIAITGVTGPKPDEDGNQVGLVHIAVARRGAQTQHCRLMLGNELPGTICGTAMREALRLALTVVKGA